ncbi:osteocalcin 2-like [Amphiprion ocellaris]|uniref:BED-type domain-containing protein n=1 Tax=Amphiprion ocellaris TaxID=80972 RepID=A0A3Q1BWZ9_AMPOC|nr:osteocalcin 2-like [Amphiprion ocellaris]
MEDRKQHVGPLGGKFEYKKNQDGTIDRQTVICTLCWKEFSFHRSTTSLKYHLNAKHSFVGDSASTSANASPSLRQKTLTECRSLGKRSPSTSAGPELKTRKIEDMVLMRLENLDKENATHKDMESTRFGYFVADMMEKIPDHKKDAVKLKIYQLLYEAVQPEKIPSKPLENGRDNSVEDPASAAGPSTSSQSIDNMLPPSEEELLGFLPEYTGSSDDVAIKQEPDTWSSDSEHTQDSSSHHISTQTKNANKHMSMKKKKLQVMQAMLQQQKRSSQAIEETGRDVRQAMQQQNLLQERMVNLLEKMIQNPSNTSASSAQSGVNEGNHEG